MNLLDLVAPLSLVFLGLMMKYSTKGDGWSTPFNKYWLYYVVGGLILLSYKVYRFI